MSERRTDFENLKVGDVIDVYLYDDKTPTRETVIDVDPNGEVETTRYVWGWADVPGSLEEETEGLSFEVVKEAPPSLAIADSVLEQAGELMRVDRMAEYGDPRENFQRIATMYQAYSGNETKPGDVAVFLALVKISRLASSLEKKDSWDDLAAYAALGAEVAGAS